MQSEALTKSKYESRDKLLLYVLIDDHKGFIPERNAMKSKDDYWLKNKLIYSIHKLNKNNAHLAGSRTFYTDQYLKITGTSINFKKKVTCYTEES